VKRIVPSPQHRKQRPRIRGLRLAVKLLAGAVVVVAVGYVFVPAVMHERREMRREGIAQVREVCGEKSALKFIRFLGDDAGSSARDAAEDWMLERCR
jgi:hypothetical protein